MFLKKTMLTFLVLITFLKLNSSDLDNSLTSGQMHFITSIPSLIKSIDYIADYFQYFNEGKNYPELPEDIKQWCDTILNKYGYGNLRTVLKLSPYDNETYLMCVRRCNIILSKNTQQRLSAALKKDGKAYKELLQGSTKINPISMEQFISYCECGLMHEISHYKNSDSTMHRIGYPIISVLVNYLMKKIIKFDNNKSSHFLIAHLGFISVLKYVIIEFLYYKFFRVRQETGADLFALSRMKDLKIIEDLIVIYKRKVDIFKLENPILKWIKSLTFMRLLYYFRNGYVFPPDAIKMLEQKKDLVKA